MYLFHFSKIGGPNGEVSRPFGNEYTGLDDPKKLFKFRFFSCVLKKYVAVVIK